jgi:D-glycero-D-manno-heptose 1,7-bisphosphate phosphatase
MNSRRFVLVDRDGTLIVERNYLADPAGVELVPGAAEGLRALAQAGFGLVLVTNQSGIARGYFSEATLAAIHARLVELLAQHDVRLDGIYHCPHAPSDECQCRKPRTLLAERAAAEHHFSLTHSFVVGDNTVDIELGRNIGATSILVETGHGTRVLTGQLATADHVVADLGAAARLIMRLAPVEHAPH